MSRLIFVVLIVALAVPVFAAPNLEPPDNYTQIIYNPDFSIGNGTCEGWELLGDASCVPSNISDGWMVSLGGADAWSWLNQVVDTVDAGCVGIGDLYVRVWYAFIVPPPLNDPGFDAAYGYIRDESYNFFPLWNQFGTLMDVDFEYDASVHSEWTVIEGYFDRQDVGLAQVEARLSFQSNETPSYFNIYGVETWCEEAPPVIDCVIYLPLVAK